MGLFDGLAGFGSSNTGSTESGYKLGTYGLDNAEFNAVKDSYLKAGGINTGLNMDDWMAQSGVSKGNVGVSSGLAGLGALKTGVDIGTGIGNLWLGYEQYGLNKDIYNTNKENAAKEYAMKKDAYDRNVARADSIGNQMNAGKVTL